jgi:hypothetical protein
VVLTWLMMLGDRRCCQPGDAIWVAWDQMTCQFPSENRYQSVCHLISLPGGSFARNGEILAPSCIK